jgi:hypothetical protein
VLEGTWFFSPLCNIDSVIHGRRILPGG